MVKTILKDTVKVVLRMTVLVGMYWIITGAGA